MKDHTMCNLNVVFRILDDFSALESNPKVVGLFHAQDIFPKKDRREKLQQSEGYEGIHQEF